MSEKNYPSLKSLIPTTGIVFYTDREVPIASVPRDLCKVTAFLQELQPYAKLIRLADWWQHDGLYFEKGSMDLHALFEIVGTPRSLFEAMPGDDLVFVGISNAERSWYLRFFVDWDDEDEHLIGEFSITIDSSLVPGFQSKVLPILTCRIYQEDAAAYFDRIEAG